MAVSEACNQFQLAVSRIGRPWVVVVGLSETNVYHSDHCMLGFPNKRCTRRTCNHISILLIHLLPIPRLIQQTIHLSLMVYRVIVSWVMLFPEPLKANQQTEVIAMPLRLLLAMGTRSCIASRGKVFEHRHW